MQFESTRFEAAVEEISDIPVLKVAGEIDVCTNSDFSSAISRAIDSGRAHLIIDLTDVSYMDSSGFGTLLGAAKRVQPRGCAVNLVGSNEAIQRMLKITRLDTVFRLFPKLDDAIEAAK